MNKRDPLRFSLKFNLRGPTAITDCRVLVRNQQLDEISLLVQKFTDDVDPPLGRNVQCVKFQGAARAARDHKSLFGE